MSSTIRESEKINQRQLQTLQRKYERELKAIENSHQDLKADLKKSHAAELVDLQDENHRQLAREAAKKEKVLSEIQTNLQKSSELTEKELKSLKTNASKEKDAIQQKLSYDRERLVAENELYIEELNHRYNDQTKKISTEGQFRLNEVRDTLRDELVQTTEFHKNKIDQRTDEFTTRYKHDDLKYEKLKDNQNNQFKKERLETNQKQQVQLKKMSEAHLSQIEKRDNTLRKGLGDQDLLFEKKYADQLDRHEKLFKELDEKNERVLQDLKSNLTKEITKVASRSEDPFFQFDTLEPKLKTFEDSVEIVVEIPEHSKEDVQLTVNGREAIVTFNRRYNDASRSRDGSIHKINKVETFTSRMPTEHLLDAKTVKAKYEDGAMIYKVSKA